VGGGEKKDLSSKQKGEKESRGYTITHGVDRKRGEIFLPWGKGETVNQGPSDGGKKGGKKKNHAKRKNVPRFFCQKGQKSSNVQVQFPNMNFDWDKDKGNKHVRYEMGFLSREGEGRRRR